MSETTKQAWANATPVQVQVRGTTAPDVAEYA